MKRLNQKATYCLIFSVIVFGFLWFAFAATQNQNQSTPDPSGYLGSSECRPCHERFYQLWAPSHHGLAMQPYTAEFAAKNLISQKEDIKIGPARYHAVIDEKGGYVIEKTAKGEQKYPILHVLGGKNVYYFLTPMQRGVLQVLPLAYDVQRREWFDTAASAVRHFPDRTDEAIHWKDRPYAFNTSCYSCHVSQLVKNYDPKTDSYNTTWKEPGINCEACHGPAEEHVRVCLEAPEGTVPKDLKLDTITQSRGFTQHQTNTACSVCHAKMSAITNEFIPGEDFFQHYDLLTLENIDFYPDGRDLGENYTFTSWRMSPCAKASKLDCIYCHTSSGRYRFHGEKANEACMPCHQNKVSNFAAHSRHEPKTGVKECIQCHMPKTEFGRMIRSDHSMRPPMPSATVQFKSPNACNLCHKDKTPQWADRHVRKWHKKDYQAHTLKLASWIDQTRKGNWSSLPEILEYLRSKDRDEVFSNSLVRLLGNCPDTKKWPVFIQLLENDPSPLIRASVASALEDDLNEKTIPVLFKAVNDPYRLVRIRTASTLASLPPEMIPQDQRKSVSREMEEFKSSLMSRPDDAMAHYNLGNFYMNRRKPDAAVNSFETSLKLQNDFVATYVNASLAYNALGRNDKAVESLTKAIDLDPKNSAAHLNLALLYGEMGDYPQAEVQFRRTFELDPRSATAAYNLGVLAAQRNISEAVGWCKKAFDLEPENAKYAYTLGFYYHQAGSTEQAIEVLRQFVQQKTTNVNIYLFLGQIYQQRRDFKNAIQVYQIAAENDQLSSQDRSAFQQLIEQF